ncbi:MAG: DMT family transporter, partial [Paenibacillus macerans]|nr:DMT family transporter [Paenibacillus macerans]
SRGLGDVYKRQNYALSKLEASRVSVFSNLSTVVSIAAGAMVLGEKVTVYHVIGSLLIIAGVTGANLLGAKSKGAKQGRKQQDREHQGRK